MTSDQGPADGSGSRTISVPYTKSDRCHTIIVDGAWGGTAPDGSVFAALYTQQQVMPSAATVEIEEGFGGAAVDQAQPAKIAREVQIELRMTTRAARALGRWFLEKADDAEDALRLIAERRQAQEDSASKTDGSE